MDFSKELRKLAKEFRKIAEPDVAEGGKLEHLQDAQLMKEFPAADSEEREEALAKEVARRCHEGKSGEFMKEMPYLMRGIDAESPAFRIMVDLILNTDDNKHLDEYKLLRIFDHDVHGFSRSSYKAQELFDYLFDLMTLNGRGITLHDLKYVLDVYHHYNIDSDSVVDAIIDYANEHIDFKNPRELQELLEMSDIIPELRDIIKGELWYMKVNELIHLHGAALRNDVKDLVDETIKQHFDPDNYEAREDTPDIRMDYGNFVADWLIDNNYVDDDHFEEGGDQHPEHVRHQLGVKALPTYFKLTDRQESLTYLRNLAKRCFIHFPGNKLSGGGTQVMSPQK